LFAVVEFVLTKNYTFNKKAVVKNSHNEKNDGKFSYGNFTQLLFHSQHDAVFRKNGKQDKKNPLLWQGIF
jgi:hypothetical protein